MTKVRGGIIVKVVNLVKVFYASVPLSESLKAERFSGQQETEKRPFVLAEAAKKFYQHRNQGRVQRVKSRSGIHQRSRRRGRPIATEGCSRAHIPNGFGFNPLGGQFLRNIQRRADQVGNLIQRLVEKNFIKPARHLLPFPLR